jgi:hypothetical protein
VNPAHLFIGTDKDNNDDMDSKKRRRPARGSRIAWAKLTESQVLEIRRLRAGGAKVVALGKQFGVTHQAIVLICRRHNWKHLEDTDAPTV